MVGQVRQLTKMEQAGDEPCYWTPGWIDNVALSSATPTSYNITAMRSAAGLPAASPFFLRIKSDGEVNINPVGAGAAISTVATGLGQLILVSNDPPRTMYIDGSITALGLYAPGTGTTNLALEVFKT